MSGFFSVHAHLAILYCCFFNGFLVCQFWYKNQPTLFKDIEAKLVFAFLISILINAIVLLGLELSTFDINTLDFSQHYSTNLIRYDSYSILRFSLSFY